MNVHLKYEKIGCDGDTPFRIYLFECTLYFELEATIGIVGLPKIPIIRDSQLGDQRKSSQRIKGNLGYVFLVFDMMYTNVGISSKF